MRNLLPKIVLGLVLVLLALHFLVSNVTVKQEGTWRQPKFSFSLGKDASAPKTPTDEQHNGRPSMWPDLVEEAKASPESEALTTTTSAGLSLPTDAIVQSDPHAHHGDESKLPCSELDGAEDVVFIIKTGATELDERMPVHFNTTLRCFPKSLIFSDHSEDYEGHIIHDALAGIVEEIRLEHSDFDLWRRLHENGRTGLDPSELSINDHGSNLGGGGNPDNGGWRLDKFKNIPMVNFTINKYPDTKWFVYTDADTYIVWSNLLKWIKLMDSTKLVYLGSQAVIGDQVFGHGGSGYLISNALMHKAADAYNDAQTEWDMFAMNNWAGDCVLATLLEKLNGKLSWAYPLFQGGDNNVMDYWETGYDKRLYCYPAISYHHIPPSTISSLWQFEQEWIKNSTERINHGDFYKQWYLPQLSQQRDGWDNLAEDDMRDEGFKDAWECRDACERNTTCYQWSFTAAGCNFLGSTRLGHAKPDVQSGWMLERLQEKVVELDKCDEGEWIMPDYHGSRRIKRTRLAANARRKYE